MSRLSVIRGGTGQCLPAAEARLLKQINRGFSDSWWIRYHELMKKRHDYLLSEPEHQELIYLSNQLEGREAKRLSALVKLAKLRKKSLRELMKALGLPKERDAC